METGRCVPRINGIGVNGNLAMTRPSNSLFSNAIMLSMMNMTTNPLLNLAIVRSRDFATETAFE